MPSEDPPNRSANRRRKGSNYRATQRPTPVQPLREVKSVGRYASRDYDEHGRKKGRP